MKTTDPRDMTWEEIQGSLESSRAAVWQWLRTHGPAKTWAAAHGTNISILTVRPRMTELAQIGLAEITGREGREGVYRALSLEEANARWAEEQRVRQPELF